MSFVEQAWRAAFAPPDRRPPWAWAEDNMRMPTSARSSEFRISGSPWIREPLEVVADNRIRQVTMQASTQSSKTFALEILTGYIVANDPGPAMICFQTEPDAQQMVETKILPDFRASPCLAKLLPTKRDNLRKDAIMFPHMPFFISAANQTSLQGKSIRWMMCDEPWMYKAGMLAEAAERVTSYWNSRIVLTSQGGIEGDDLDKAFRAGDQREWGFTCPHCSTWQPFKWGQVRYEEIIDDRGEFMFDAIRKTVRYECAECEHPFPDNVTVRRQLASLGSYQAQNPGAPSDNISFHWNRLTVYWNEWGKLVEQWLKANQAKARGDMELLKKFIQKVLGECWREADTDFDVPVGRADFEMGAGWEHEGEINGAKLRVMTVDVQQDCFYLVIRSWSNLPGRRGHSRLRYVKCRAVSWEDLRDVQLAHGVADGLVFVDSRHKPRDVYHHCAKYGWNALMGDDAKDFPHHKRDKVTGKRVEVRRYYSRRTLVMPGNGRCWVYRWSNLSVKDTLAALRQHQAAGVTWEAAGDAPEEYFQQMDSEARREVKPGVWRWIKTRPNHLWDCEAMQVVVAYMLRLVGEESLEGGEDDTAGEECAASN